MDVISTVFCTVRAGIWHQAFYNRKRKLRHDVIETHSFDSFCLFCSDRLRECYGTLPNLCRYTAFSWVTETSPEFKIAVSQLPEKFLSWSQGRKLVCCTALFIVNSSACTTASKKRHHFCLELTRSKATEWRIKLLTLQPTWMSQIQKLYLSSDIGFHDVMFSSKHIILSSSCKYFQVSALFKESARVYLPKIESSCRMWNTWMKTQRYRSN